MSEASRRRAHSMRKLAWIALLGLLPCGLAAQDVERCFVTVEAPATAFVEQPVEVAVTLGWDRAWFDQFGVAMSRQRPDVPVYLELPWLAFSREREVALLPASSQAETVAVGDRLVPCARLADVRRGDRDYARVQLRVRWVPLNAGAQQLEAARARYAYATEFREHLLRGREPVDRREGAVTSEALELVVERPGADAPADYTGAVGEFEVRLTSAGQEVCVGEPFEVEMFVFGDGNVRRFGKPLRVPLDGFYVQGVLEAEGDAAGPPARRFVFDVVPLRAGMTELKGLSLPVFSPRERAFVRLEDGPVPVRVLPRRAGAALPEAIEELVRQDAAAREDGPGWLRWVFVGLAVGGLLLHRFGQRSRRRRELERAMGEVRSALAADDSARAASAFEALLARVGGGQTFAAPIVWESLQKVGVAPDGLARLKELHAALDQARFGGPAPDPDDVLAASETLHHAARM